MLPPRLEALAKTSRREVWLACAYLLILFSINAYVCQSMFYTATAQMHSMHGFWTALAMRANGSWFHIAWWPFWDNGIPFEATYPPLVPGLAALISSLRGVPAAIGFASVTGLCYILGPCTLFLMAWRLTQAPGYSFLAALLYSLTSISQLLAPDAEFALKTFWDHRRLFVVAVWDDTPHVAALVCLPLVILFLARSIETRRFVYYASAAVTIALAALASAFGPIMVIMAAACLLFVLRRDRWLGNLLLIIGIGAYGWAIASPFLSPSLILAIRRGTANSDDQGWTVGSLTAIAVVIFGWVVLWEIVKRCTSDWRVQFFVLFAWMTSSLPMVQTLLGRHFLPQPNRYKFEMEVAVSLALVFTLRPWFDRLPIAIRRALLMMVITLAAGQVMEHAQSARDFVKPADVTKTVEYRAATWAERNQPGLRFFMPGSVAQWTNTFTGIQQFTGGSFTIATNGVQQLADQAMVFCTESVAEDARRTLLWLKAYGIGAIAISAKESEEYWKAYTHPEKFEGALPVLWREGGVTIYRVPVRETGLAHIVPRSAVLQRSPKSSEDLKDVEKFAAALDDPALPTTTFQWEGRNRIRIRTTAASGQALSIQESYHPGWHATVTEPSVIAQSRPIRQDGLGLMWLLPDCNGPCEITLNYDGGWELRICHALSWLALAGLVLIPVYLLVRRRAQA